MQLHTSRIKNENYNYHVYHWYTVFMIRWGFSFSPIVKHLPCKIDICALGSESGSRCNWTDSPLHGVGYQSNYLNTWGDVLQINRMLSKHLIYGITVTLPLRGNECLCRRVPLLRKVVYNTRLMQLLPGVRKWRQRFINKFNSHSKYAGVTQRTRSITSWKWAVCLGTAPTSPVLAWGDERRAALTPKEAETGTWDKERS